MSYGATEASLVEAAQRQYRRAAEGAPLSDYRQAEDIALFWPKAGSNAEAYLKGAYWLAVAARLTGNPFLRAKSRDLLASGVSRIGIPGHTLVSDDVDAIYRDAGQVIAGFPQAVAVAKILGVQADPTMTSGKQQIYEQTPVFQVVDALKQTAMTIDQPKKWPWYTWAIIGGSGLLLVGALYIATKPYQATARQAYGRARRAIAAGG